QRLAAAELALALPRQDRDAERARRGDGDIERRVAVDALDRERTAAVEAREVRCYERTVAGAVECHDPFARQNHQVELAVAVHIGAVEADTRRALEPRGPRRGPGGAAPDRDQAPAAGGAPGGRNGHQQVLMPVAIDVSGGDVECRALDHDLACRLEAVRLAE